MNRRSEKLFIYSRSVYTIFLLKGGEKRRLRLTQRDKLDTFNPEGEIFLKLCYKIQLKSAPANEISRKTTNTHSIL